MDMEIPPPREQPPVSAQEIMQRLRVRGYSPSAISRLLGGSIATRTLYRWEQGETQPLTLNDHRDLYQLAVTVGVLGIEKESETVAVF